MASNIKKRRLQFSLRTVLFAITLAAPVFAWIAYSLEWIRQRHIVLDGPSWTEDYGKINPRHNIRAPAGLWLFGENGVSELMWVGKDDEEYEHAKRVFPEAQVLDTRQWNDKWPLSTR